jgi:hypothetical protein
VINIAETAYPLGVLSNNLYFPTDSVYTNLWHWRSSDLSTYAAWVDSSGETGSVNTDPHLTSATNFSLLANSGAINKGTTWGGQPTTDYNGNNTISGGSNPDLGAIEMQAGTVTTQAATTATTTTATGNGNITSIGSFNATARGFEWGTSTGVYTTSVTTSGDYGTGAYTGSLTSLPSETTVYLRAKATNPVATVYGAEVTITTLLPAKPFPRIITPFIVTPKYIIPHTIKQ